MQEPSADQAPRKRGLAGAALTVAKGRWQKVRDAVKGIHRAMKLAMQDRTEFQNASKQAITKATMGMLDVKLDVKDVKDLQKINYMQQGNADMYTEDVLKQRHKIRVDPAVIKAIKDWWNWVPREDTGTGKQARVKKAAKRASTTGDAPEGVIKPVYCAMVVLIQLVLLPRFGMEADENYDPEEDWEADAKGGSPMLYPDFFDALFELADMWCDTTSAPDYAELLAGLLRDAQELESKHGIFSKLMNKFGYTPSADWLRAYSIKGNYRDSEDGDGLPVKPEPLPVIPEPEPEPAPPPPPPPEVVEEPAAEPEPAPPSPKPPVVVEEEEVVEAPPSPMPVVEQPPAVVEVEEPVPPPEPPAPSPPPSPPANVVEEPLPPPPPPPPPPPEPEPEPEPPKPASPPPKPASPPRAPPPPPPVPKPKPQPTPPQPPPSPPAPKPQQPPSPPRRAPAPPPPPSPPRQSVPRGSDVPADPKFPYKGMKHAETPPRFKQDYKPMGPFFYEDDGDKGDPQGPGQLNVGMVNLGLSDEYGAGDSNMWYQNYMRELMAKRGVAPPPMPQQHGGALNGPANRPIGGSPPRGGYPMGPRYVGNGSPGRGKDWSPQRGKPLPPVQPPSYKGMSLVGHRAGGMDPSYAAGGRPQGVAPTFGSSAQQGGYFGGYMPPPLPGPPLGVGMGMELPDHQHHVSAKERAEERQRERQERQARIEAARRLGINSGPPQASGQSNSYVAGSGGGYGNWNSSRTSPRRYSTHHPGQHNWSSNAVRYSYPPPSFMNRPNSFTAGTQGPSSYQASFLYGQHQAPTAMYSSAPSGDGRAPQLPAIAGPGAAHRGGGAMYGAGQRRSSYAGGGDGRYGYGGGGYQEQRGSYGGGGGGYRNW